MNERKLNFSSRPLPLGKNKINPSRVINNLNINALKLESMPFIDDTML